MANDAASRQPVSTAPSQQPEAGPSRLSDAAAAQARPQSLESVYRRRSAFSFPRAAQPEIVRAYQKDVYYRELLQTQLQDVVRGMLGSRTLFAHADTISFFGSLAYFTLSTLSGAQTLGEEYVNAMMTDGRTGRIVAVRRRMLFIVYYVVAPFAASRAYAATRRRLVAAHQTRSQALQRARLRAAAVAPRRGEASKHDTTTPQPSRVDRIIGILAERLPTTDAFNTSSGVLAYLGAAHLALFYLGGRYYKISQRFARTEYISTIARRPGSKPPSYEVLGFLLGVQLLIKMLMQANRWRAAWMQQKKLAAQGASEKSGASAPSSVVAGAAESVQIDDTVWSHKTTPPTRAGAKARLQQVPLVYADPDGLPSAHELGLPSDVSRSQLEAARAAAKVKAAELEAVSDSLLRCTLCMEQREPQKGTSAVTECGHVFCWDCIVGWSREKLECPLCRQSLNPSHLLPIYNF